MDIGWVKIHRKLLDNPVVMKDTDYMAIWFWLLLNATHEGISVFFGGEKITLKPGQFTTGRKKIAQTLGVSESKVQRVLKCFESEQQIEQRTDKQCRLITILKWKDYQKDEQRFEQQMNNDRTTSEQRVNTKQECKNERMKETDSEAATPPAIAEPTPSDLAQAFFSPDADRSPSISYLIGKGMPEEMAKREILRFVAYWTEPSKNGKKIRWQEEKFFHLGRRLATWFLNVEKRGGASFNQETKGIQL